MPKRHDLPSTYYRVSLKALILNEQRQLLVLQDKTGEWELPGGGLEHQESVGDCLAREITEEIDCQIASFEQAPRFVYIDHEPPGYYKLSIAYAVTLQPGEIVLADEDLARYRYVDQHEFLQLPFQLSEQTVQDYAEQIWPK